MTWRRYTEIGANWASMCVPLPSCHCITAITIIAITIIITTTTTAITITPHQHGHHCIAAPHVAGKHCKLHRITLVQNVSPKSYNPLRREAKIRSPEPNDKLNTMARCSKNITTFSCIFKTISKHFPIQPSISHVFTQNSILHIGEKLWGKPQETKVCMGKYTVIGRIHTGTMGKYQDYIRKL